MINRDIYQKDPTLQKLVNEGVASVNDEFDDRALAVLRYELETFVCKGQYEGGMHLILQTYLANIDKEQQPSVWVSGFYGSGKSHLVKMLRALWVDTAFSDGATARGTAKLPQDISDQLKELSTQAKKHGGLHAASGTLGSGASGSVRLALLGIIFRSAGLPEQYPVARFVMWLKQEGILDEVRDHVVKNGSDWDEELDNFHVSEALRHALVAAKPNLFSSVEACETTINNQYSNVQDVSNDEMLKSIRQALTRDGKFPLTLIVLDEVQQYIGESADRSISVQEMVESLTKNIGGKMLFVGTGQTAVTGTANLARLQGRFTIRIELSDTDVDDVIRQVILAKKPEAQAPIQQIAQTNSGEISRHLAGSTIGHRQADLAVFSQDYPILPVRRRFWENTLRVLDQTGTDSQLRNQLGMVHKVIKTNLDATLGNVIGADYLYFESADKMLQARILPRKVHEKTMSGIQGGDDERLAARATGLVFLINKLSATNSEIGIKANIDTIADLLVEDLANGSSTLRAKLPGVLDSCELLMKVGDEYRIQTEESTEWNNDFLSQRNTLSSEAHRVESERDDRIRAMFSDQVRGLTLLHGNSKIARDITRVFDAKLPVDAEKKTCVWVRDGWGTDENTVRVDARSAGNQSPTVFVFIPKRSADDLRHNLIEYKAASSTLDKRGVPNTAEGQEARSAMETTKLAAEAKIRELLNDAFSGARVFQGGGSEISEGDLKSSVQKAAENALQRLYPQFNTGDNTGWAKVLEKAQKGAPDALKDIGDDGEPANNAVCKAILGFIGGGKNGTDVRNQFEDSPYGWPRDAVDGALYVLLVAGVIRAQDERGQGVDATKLERKSIGKVTFKVESTTVSTAQRLQIRGLMQKVGISAKSNEEHLSVPKFLEVMLALADRAGGEAPKPERPDTKALEEIRLTAGNEQLIAVFNRREEFAQAIDAWTDFATSIEQRLSNWLILKRLIVHAAGLADAEVIAAQVETIEQQRQLLVDPDPVTPLLVSITQILRDELNALASEFETKWNAGGEKLKADSNFMALNLDERLALRAAQQLVESARPVLNVDNTAAVVNSLDFNGLSALHDRVAALPSRFEKVSLAAAKEQEPDVEQASLPSRMLKTDADVDQWLADTGESLKQQIKRGPVIV